MYTVWRTEHPINQRVVDSFHIGSFRLGENAPGFTMKAVELYHRHNNRPPPSISYGFLRGTEKIFQDCIAQNQEWWEIDRGYFKPNHFDGYYRISHNGIMAPMQCNALPSDRWDRLGIALRPWRDDLEGKPVLICPPTDAVEKLYDITADFTDFPLTDHKRIRDKRSNVPLEEDLSNCSKVITYNSAVALEALTRGIPAYCHLLKADINRGDDRRPLFNWLAYNQFTLNEFKSGEAWKIAHSLQKYGELP